MIAVRKALRRFAAPHLVRRQRDAERLAVQAVRVAEEQSGYCGVLWKAYADAIARYDLGEWKPAGVKTAEEIDEAIVEATTAAEMTALVRAEGVRTVAENLAETRSGYDRMIDAESAYIRSGSKESWDAFSETAVEFAVHAAAFVSLAELALHESVPGFSEFTDPAFADLLEVLRVAQGVRSR